MSRHCRKALLRLIRQVPEEEWYDHTKFWLKDFIEGVLSMASAGKRISKQDSRVLPIVLNAYIELKRFELLSEDGNQERGESD